MAKQTAAPVVEEVQEVELAGNVLRTWFGGIATFLTQARTLEAKAGALETTAATLREPTTAAADAELQRFVQTATATAKEVSAHWEIAASVHRFHKLLVSYRERGVSKAERAGAIAQRLHNRYVESERRRVEDENARRQAEADAQAKADRDREAAALEARALEAEQASADLSAREEQYVVAMVVGMTSIEAARLAGYKDPAGICGRLAATAKIQRAIFGAKQALAARQQAAAVREQPLASAPIEAAAPNVTKIGSDRSSWKGEVLDEQLFIKAVVEGKLGIPLDVLTIDQAALTRYARSLHELMNAWPGVRAVKSTTTV